MESPQISSIKGRSICGQKGSMTRAGITDNGKAQAAAISSRCFEDRLFDLGDNDRSKIVHG